jgi:hypothetical protein
MFELVETFRKSIFTLSSCVVVVKLRLRDVVLLITGLCSDCKACTNGYVLGGPLDESFTLPRPALVPATHNLEMWCSLCTEGNGGPKLERWKYIPVHIDILNLM